MRRRLLLCVAAAALALGGAGGAVVASADASTAQAAVPASHCKRGYVNAKLSWGHKCLKAGQFCKVGNAEYVRYGFVCPPSGHLRRR